MRRLWKSLLVLPVLGAVLPAAFGTSAMAATARPARAAHLTSRTHAAVGGARAAATGSTMRAGMSGSQIKQLQHRLAQLGYYPGNADGHFGTNTLEAVWAFEEAQGLPTVNWVSSAMQRALANPRAPRVLVPGGGSERIEINLSRELLVLYRNNRPALISHVSSGGGYAFCNPGGFCTHAITPTGNYRTTVFMAGAVTVPLGSMYNPVFFIGTTFAIHGDTDVPLQPVSHGCVRIPMDIAAFFHTLVRIPGTPVYLRH